MGYTHGTKWTEEIIEIEIKRTMEMLDTRSMPSVSDLVGIGAGGLANAISRTHGFYGWASRLGLQIKNSETQMGKYYEEVFDETMINTFGYESEGMSTRFPYDRLVEGVVKVDIKSGFQVKVRNSLYYTFNLETPNRKSDILVCYCLTEAKEIAKAYVIPSVIMQGKKQLSVGVINSKYDGFINRYDLIGEYISFYKKILEANKI